MQDDRHNQHGNQGCKRIEAVKELAITGSSPVRSASPYALSRHALTRFGTVGAIFALSACTSMPPPEIDTLHRDLRAAWVPMVSTDDLPVGDCKTFYGDCWEYAKCAGVLSKRSGLFHAPVITEDHAATIVIDRKGGAWLMDTVNKMPVRAW